ncbi:DUF6064 family protein [Mesorhizobium sp. 1B3]|uniref:DUF6064 family protein n=1 Tax=Mesorhizobium sp. 1B3 TaxID=3243599 RepID=UPI003D978D1D
MSDWWTYRPQDLLLFSPRVYWRMFELHNAAFWPLHVLTLAIGFGLVMLVSFRPRGSGPWIAFALAALWAFVAWSFLWHRFAAINWAITYVVPLFGLQALMLAIGGWSRGLVFDRKDIAARIGLLLALAGIFAYPLLPSFFGRPWTSAETFGLAPDPTAVVALGFLLTAGGGLTLPLLVIPVFWLLLSGITLRTMGDPQAWMPFSATAIAVGVLVVRRILSASRRG